MNFSIVLASRERVSLLTKFFDSLVNNTHDLSNIEVLVGIDHCDQETCSAEQNLTKNYPFVRFYRRNRSPRLNQDYLNWLTNFTSGDYIIACNDDVEVRTKNWDKVALETLDNYLSNRPDGIVYGFIEDGLSNRYGMNYCCFPLFSRKSYNTLGWLLPGVFNAWNADIAAWRVYSAVDRVCTLPIMFYHISYHTGQRERDHVSKQMERLSSGSPLGSQYDITEDVERLNKAMVSAKGWLPIGKNGIVYSFLIPTRERPEMLWDFIESVEKNTINKEKVEICIAYDSNDTKTASQMGKFNRRFGKFIKFFGKQRSSMINRDYLNWLFKFSSGGIIIPANDDCKLLTHGWDDKVLQQIKSFVKPDGIAYGRTNIKSFPVLTRTTVEQLGYVFEPNFPYWGAEVCLERLMQHTNRLFEADLLFEHYSPRDSVNMILERQASRITVDPHRLDLEPEINRLNEFISYTIGQAPKIIVKEKPHLLFVTEKWCDGNPQAGLTNSQHNLFGSLEIADIASYSQLHFDEYHLKHGRPVDEELLKVCRERKPTMVIGSYLCHPAHLNVKRETWSQIKEMGIPIVFIWFDSVLPFVSNIIDSLSEFATLNVTLDTSNPPCQSKVLPLWTPQDVRRYFNPHGHRDIDVCFLGSMQGYMDRIVGIEALKYNGIEVVQMGGQRENPLPVDAYAGVLQRSKICLNFPQYRGAPFIQAKGRIFEATLCGALLMDADNEQTRKWFNPDEHYIAFKDERDLVEKVKYYLNNDEARGRIAQTGWLKASTCYTPKNFWKAIVEEYENLQ